MKGAFFGAKLGVSLIPITVSLTDISDALLAFYAG
jgi:hypothetical protein